MLQRIDIDDSDSDDEPPPAIKFSKVTQALLGDAPVPSSPPKQEHRIERSRSNRALNSSIAGGETPSRPPALKIIRKSSPASIPDGSRGRTPPRVIQLGSKGSGSAAKRSISINGSYPQRYPAKRDPTPSKDANAELVTPAPAPRAIRVRTRANSAASQDGNGPSSSRPGSRNGARSAVEAENDNNAADLGRSTSSHQPPETISRFGMSTIARSHNSSAEAAPPPGSQRVKRAPLTGSFLMTGPARRFRRRESEDNVSPKDEIPNDPGSASQPGSASHGSDAPQQSVASKNSASQLPNETVANEQPVSVHDFANKNNTAYQAQPRSRQANSYLSRSLVNVESQAQTSRSHEHIRSEFASPEIEEQKSSSRVENDEEAFDPNTEERRTAAHQAQQRSALEQKPLQRVPSLRGAQQRYAAPARKIQTDAYEDQENMPPPTFKRNKDQEFKHLGKPTITVLSDEGKSKSRQVDETPVPFQQEQRKALSTISGNTPHRAAPAPPPKMSVIDTATTSAGASVTKSKKKRSHIIINHKVYTSLGEIGKGGSCQVLGVMAENHKTFALKKVDLKKCDESAVRGYKGEIDLLKKLTNVERVVQLFDWELNEEKEDLYILMERGETDFSRLLTLRIEGENNRFDPVFTRYHWREMLECVQAVHDEDIVHSDLKPANFLLVRGRLKLIDFGIANAIDTDHTVNVHRDTHVGTPNYMSPESINDTNAPPPGSTSSNEPMKKDMRIGKASDVWSLGCILYQMTYGKPPFGHIRNQLPKIMAITNPNHAIAFPETGIGGATIPHSLRGCLRRCLNRDPEKRPTAKQLLHKDDPYMHPERDGVVILDEGLLGQIIAKVVERCSTRGIPSEGEVKGYPRSFMEKVWEMQEKG